MILVNGVATSHIDALDRGLHYADGLFETIAVRNGNPELWTEHLFRLEAGCRRLNLAMPSPTVLLEEVGGVVPAVGRAVAKIVITRGSGGRGYRPPEPAQPCRLVVGAPWPDYPSHWPMRGVRVRRCHTRLGITPSLAGMKHLARLEQVMARAEWTDPDIAEGLMLDPEGRVAEGTMTNLFVLLDGELVTPRMDRCGVAGVMREAVMKLAKVEDVPCREGELDWPELADADEVFLTNSLIRIWPVRMIDELRGYPVGAVTRRLQGALDRQLGG